MVVTRCYKFSVIKVVISDDSVDNVFGICDVCDTIKAKELNREWIEDVVWKISLVIHA